MAPLCPGHSHTGTQLERAEKTIDLVRAEKACTDDARAEAADKAKRAEAELKLRKEEVVTLKTMLDTQAKEVAALKAECAELKFVIEVRLVR